ncbi:MAG TPA: aminotransferase class I/II-fold pyridoxal phosphate-dependent enzyme [Acidimicrobiales bacterium]|nr:aminotransferase class I/II-fold pyridoxal phosphate-dependent enzyme [Acidimicrobiales bacterium]
MARALGVAPEAVLDLSATLNPVAPDPVPIVSAHLDAIRRYPSPEAAEAHLARTMALDPDRVVLTNGGSEAIALVAADQPCGWVDEPEFSLYRRHLARVDPGAPRWRSNPHNPSGLLADGDARAAVWDEAFWPLATGTWTRGDADSGSTVIGSLTKLLACPGLRLGYVICADADQATRLRLRRPEWSVNGPALAALPDLLRPVDLVRWSTAVGDLKRDLRGILERAGFPVRSADAPWVLVDSAGLRDHLAARAICIRDCASFGWPGTVRIAVPGPDGLGRIEEALAR